MKNILWVGNPFFGKFLEKFGFSVNMPNLDYRKCYGWMDLLQTAGYCSGDTPDILVVADKSLPPFVCGIEDFPCLTIFYAVDTHIHSWYPYYAQAFDLCLISLKDHIPMFLGKRLQPERVIWMPPYAPDVSTLPSLPEHSEPEWKLLFVGKIDQNLNPDRYRFMEELKLLYPDLHCTHGDFVKLYPKGQLVLNHSIDRDLNFRVFEALGTGSCLLTPMVGNGFTDLFTDREDLFIYDQSDIKGLVRLANDLLSNPEKVSQARHNGRAKIDAGHRASHRAKHLAEVINDMYDTGAVNAEIASRFKNAQDIHTRYLRLIYLLHAESADFFALREAYLLAAKRC